MAWSFLGEVDDESLTAGEWEHLFLLVNLSMPHREVDIDPAHCPVCRNCHAIVILERETSLEEAAKAVGEMPATALVDAFMPEE